MTKIVVFKSEKCKLVVINVSALLRTESGESVGFIEKSDQSPVRNCTW